MPQQNGSRLPLLPLHVELVLVPARSSLLDFRSAISIWGGEMGLCLPGPG